MLSFGERLRRQREKRGWSQVHLAQLSKVPFETISRLETGKHKGPRLEVAAKLAKALGITLDYLAGTYEDDETDAPSLALGGAG